MSKMISSAKYLLLMAAMFMSFGISAIAFAIVPILWMVLTSLKSNREITQDSSLFPEVLTPENYVSLFSGREFGAYLTNSIIVTAASVAIALALGTMAAGLAHELNNPIGVISSRIEIMLLDAEAQPVYGQLAEDLRVLHRHAQRVARIAQGLLSFSRQSSERRGPVDLNHLVEETLLLVERPIAKQGVKVTRRLAPDLPPLWGDGNTLQQVVLNLLTNARDAVDGGGEVTVETSRAGCSSSIRARR